MFMRPGWAKSLKDNRPTPANKPNRNDDEDFVMMDMDDGTEWYEPWMNITHEVGDSGAVRDVPTTAPRLTDHCYGLHLTLNSDW